MIYQHLRVPAVAQHSFWYSVWVLKEIKYIVHITVYKLLKILRICLINYIFNSEKFCENTMTVWKPLYHLYSPIIAPVKTHPKQH